METHFPVVPIGEVPRQAHPGGPDRDRPVILVVDDEQLITYTLAAILNCSGYTALTAQDPGQALETARLIPPHVLITDLVMGETSGIDLAFEVRRIAADCEVILMTGQISAAERSEEARLQDLGFFALSKPVFPADLLACIADRLGKRKTAESRATPIMFPLVTSAIRGGFDERRLPGANSDKESTKVLPFTARAVG